mgnify:FL=1
MTGTGDFSPKKKDLQKTSDKAWSPAEVVKQRTKGTYLYL